MKFTLCTTATVRRTYEVEAENRSEAIELFQEAVWSDTHYENPAITFIDVEEGTEEP